MTDPDQFAAQVRADALTRLEAVQEMQRRLQGLVGHGESPDRRVVLTVTPTGAITDLRLSPAALHLAPGERAPRSWAPRPAPPPRSPSG